MDLDLEVRKFKFDLLRKMPFYGDIVMRLPFVENKSIPTARTNGGKIEYNPSFLAGMTRGQRNFVLMHEVFHVILFHCKRHRDRDPRLWNTAADMIVNNMLLNLMHSMNASGIPFERPVDGIFSNVNDSDTVENIYDVLLADNSDIIGKNNVRVNVRINRLMSSFTKQVTAPDDLVTHDPDESDADDGETMTGTLGNGFSKDGELSEQAVLQVIRDSAAKNRGDAGSFFVPAQLFSLVESRHIKWQTLLRDFFVEERSEEASYDTPERKYIHMDLILPGNGPDDEKLEEIWAFVDSSGSVGKNEMEQFLTQLYRIAKEFKCVFNICYWDTQVTDVYTQITKEDDILKSLPHHSGGTDINCVYLWMEENKVKPDVMLILTDGYFGTLKSGVFKPSLGKKTILVLSGKITVSEEMKRIGKITRLE